VIQNQGRKKRAPLYFFFLLSSHAVDSYVKMAVGYDFSEFDILFICATYKDKSSCQNNIQIILQ